MSSLHAIHVVGARPNFVKAAPVLSALGRRAVLQTLIRTGQHYDSNMTDVFFEELEMPPPAVNLEVGSGSHAVQTAQIMVRFEEAIQASRPDLALVYGNVNSAIAASLVCANLLVPVGHVEAGLRSFDRTMPEEINRLLARHGPAGGRGGEHTSRRREARSGTAAVGWPRCRPYR